MAGKQTGGRDNTCSVLAVTVYQGETGLGKGGPGSPDCHPVLCGMSSDGTSWGSPDHGDREKLLASDPVAIETSDLCLSQIWGWALREDFFFNCLTGWVVLVWFCLFFFLQNFLHVRMFFLHVPMCASTHRGHCIHWNWSYRHL